MLELLSRPIPKFCRWVREYMITGAGEYSGVYTVSDKGSKIKGQKVDVFVGSYAEAKQFGRKQVYVAVLDRPEKTARARRQPARHSGRMQGMRA